jgi:hypothetical protein
MDTHLPPQWKLRLRGILTGKIEPLPHEVDRFLEAQARAEGSLSDQPKAQWNPLNTTMSEPGATPFNTFVVGGVTYHVWNYPKPVVGIAATAKTLVLPMVAGAPLTYGRILGFIQNPGSTTAEAAVDYCADQIRTWGTNPDTMRAVLDSLP